VAHVRLPEFRPLLQEPHIILALDMAEAVVDATGAQVFIRPLLYQVDSILGGIAFSYDISYEVKHDCDPCKKVNYTRDNPN
jgi:hypothetical protein